MATQEKLKRVPAAEVPKVEQSFRKDGATHVEKTDNGDGTFDVIATFP